MAYEPTKLDDDVNELGTFFNLRSISHLCQVAAVIKGLSVSQVDRVWWLASQRYDRDALHSHFLAMLERKRIDELFCAQARAWATKSLPLFVRPDGAVPLIALRAALLEVTTLSSGTEPDETRAYVQWGDFSWSLMRILVEDGHAGEELSALLLEHDLGL